mmetsp:Transcript_21193/g.42779  ORF Transcript_21193/g.42779 Transcript_21193/m.42779 type:complete len:222 (-) Transcript_21193:138-803(-)
MFLSRLARSTFLLNPTKRNFFASSTDHSRLLDSAEVHRVDYDGRGCQYVLVAHGTDKELVVKVPQLHLARIWLDSDGKTVFGAKVVNRTLGKPVDVCGRVLDAALSDAGEGALARSCLHGLSDWVDRGISTCENIPILSELGDAELSAVDAIAKGKCHEDAYNMGRDGWERLARDFLSRGLGEEAMLYDSKGGRLERIEHLADDGEFKGTSGGTVAIFSFS